MVIIVNKTDKHIINYGNSVEYLSNGSPHLIDRNLRYEKDKVLVYEGITLPKEVEPSKWCYTPEEGFYKNPDFLEYTEPSPTDWIDPVTVDAIKDIAIEEVQNAVNS